MPAVAGVVGGGVMHQPLEDFEPLGRTLARVRDVLDLAEDLYTRQAYGVARDAMADVVKLSALLHKRLNVLARVKARG